MVSKRLRLLQGIAVILILFAIKMFILDGQSLFDSVVVGITYAVYALLPIVVVFLLYWQYQSVVDGAADDDII